MLDKWIADAVGRMHVAEITGKRLAAECGYTESYLSTVLHGKKGDSATQKKTWTLWLVWSTKPLITMDRAEVLLPAADTRVLCATLLDAVRRFYENPENQQRFEAWLSEKKTQGGKLKDD